LWNRAYYAHRLAWLYAHHELPTEYIDHINRDKDDNRISNLRVADHSMNKFNSKIYAGSKSGHNGVVFCKITQKWRAQIKRNGKHYRGSLHETLESAVAERKELETKVFPDFHKIEDKPDTIVIDEASEMTPEKWDYVQNRLKDKP
jgi:hypothetical protein